MIKRESKEPINLPAKTEGRVAALPTGAQQHAPRGGLPSLTLGAIGVVYGDIGTSPLYAMDQIFQPGLARTPENVLGGVSLVVWALTLIVAIKYACWFCALKMRARAGSSRFTACCTTEPTSARG